MELVMRIGFVKLLKFKNVIIKKNLLCLLVKQF